MANYPHLSRHSKSGNLCFRRGVPAALREIVGKREITKSFGTNVLKDALPDYHRIATETERLFKILDQIFVLDRACNRLSRKDA